MTAKRIPLIGGPWNGEIRISEDGYEYFKVTAAPELPLFKLGAVKNKMEYFESIYRRTKLAYGYHRFYAWVHDSVPPNRVVDMMELCMEEFPDVYTLVMESPSIAGPNY